MELFMVCYNGGLEDLLKRKEPPDRYLRRLMQQTLRALFFLAEKNIIHRDIKPDNILYDANRDFYLADFGISKEQDLNTTPVGTPQYMAPELFFWTTPPSDSLLRPMSSLSVW
jgi:serine/threonine protein kinase